MDGGCIDESLVIFERAELPGGLGVCLRTLPVGFGGWSLRRDAVDLEAVVQTVWSVGFEAPYLQSHETLDQGHWAARLEAELRNAAYEGEAGHQKQKKHSSHLDLDEQANETQAFPFTTRLQASYHPFEAYWATARQ